MHDPRLDLSYFLKTRCFLGNWKTLNKDYMVNSIVE